MKGERTNESNMSRQIDPLRRRFFGTAAKTLAAGRLGSVRRRPRTIRQYYSGRRATDASFWECTCINWIRTAPYIKAWNHDYVPLGLVVLGVHAAKSSSSARALRTSTVAFGIMG
jgi:hypothetical protein